MRQYCIDFIFITVCSFVCSYIISNVASSWNIWKVANVGEKLIHIQYFVNKSYTFYSISRWDFLLVNMFVSHSVYLCFADSSSVVSDSWSFQHRCTLQFHWNRFLLLLQVAYWVNFVACLFVFDELVNLLFCIGLWISIYYCVCDSQLELIHLPHCAGKITFWHVSSSALLPRQ